MKLIVCLDDNLGMMFNHRRQSRDRELIADLVRYVENTPLWISPYSAPLFGEGSPCLQVVDDPVASASENDYCFVENSSLPKTLDGVNELIIYHWNRLYPSDVRFECDTSAFTLAKTHEFAGSSHDKITKEIWKK